MLNMNLQFFAHKKGAELLMKSLVLGLQGIQTTYGNEFIVLEFKEV